MVKHVEEIGAQLELDPFGKGSVLVNCEVKLLVGGSVQRVAAFVAEVPRARACNRSQYLLPRYNQSTRIGDLRLRCTEWRKNSGHVVRRDCEGCT